MLRLIVLALFLTNSVYFAWSQGLLRAYGFAPAQQREPQRLAQQIRPEALRLLAPDEVHRAESVAPQPSKAPECLQAGLFDDKQSEFLRGTLGPVLPAGSWLMAPVLEPAHWIVYMGKYANAEALARKRAELASLKLRFEPLTNPALEPGLSLGGFETQGAAQAALASLSRRGVRTARVVQERAEVRGSLLKIPAADETLRARLDEFKAALAGKPLRPCK